MYKLHFLSIVINFLTILATGYATIQIRFYDQLIPNNFYYLLTIISGIFFIFFDRINISTSFQNFLARTANISKYWFASYSLILLLIIFTQSGLDFSRIWLIFWGASTWIALVFVNFSVYRYSLRQLGSSKNQQTVVIIGNNPTAKKLAESIEKNLWLNYSVIEHMIDLNSSKLKTLQNIKVDEIWICANPEQMSNLSHVLKSLEQSPARIRLSIDFSEYRLLNHGIDEIDTIPMIDLSAPPFSGASNLVKLLEDYLGSLIILILLSPVMTLIAALVKLNSPGPVFYRQKRTGLNGKEFEMLKFRSMPIDTEKSGIQWGNSEKKVKDNFSLFLRRYNLDELPQFFNVLMGHMSIVGPRPERIEFISEFAKEISHYNKKHLVKAGITGWAQVNGLRGDTDLKKRIEYDLYYIEHWTFFFDIKIIFLTVLEPFIKPKDLGN